MKNTPIFTLLVLLTVTLSACKSSSSSRMLRGTWQLQEVQVPPEYEYSKTDASDYDPLHYSLFFSSDGPVTEYNYPNSEPTILNRWDNYTIYNDTILTLSNVDPDGKMVMWQTFIIKKLTKDELVLAYGYGLDGIILYKYVRNGDLPIQHTKHNISAAVFDVNPIVKRISQEEIAQNETPAAVAYNLVAAIYNSDYDTFLSNLSPEFRAQCENAIASDGYSSFESSFSEPDSKLNIKGWKEKMDSGDYEIAVLYVQDEWFDKYGRECKKVYVDCVPSTEVGKMGFQDITRDGKTNVKPLVVNDNGKWKVIGFK